MRGQLLVRPIHTSWLMAWACVGIVIGVSLVGVADTLASVSFAWLLTGIAMVATSLWRGQTWMIVLALAGGCIIGVWRGSLLQGDIMPYGQLYGRGVVVHGMVRDDVERDKRGRDVLRVGDVTVEGSKLAGMVWVTIDHDDRIKRSDRVMVAGKLTNGFGGFTAAMYDATLVRVQREQPGDIALNIRDHFAAGVATALKEPEASLGLGYLVGMRRGLPEEFDEALRAAGLTHIVVASGYNLTILVRLARRLFERISKYLAFLTAGSLIGGFIAITGVSPSMSRAGLVGGLALAAWYYGRRIHPLVLLPFAMAATLLIQPQYAWGDIGWQLSFAAFAGVMILAPLLQAYFFTETEGHQLRRILVETIAAYVCTLPILLVTFGSFSLIAPLSNLVILPLVPLAMLLTFIAGIAGLVIPGIAPLIGLPAQGLLTYMTQTAQFMGGLDWAVQSLSLNVVGLITWYGLLVGIVMWMWRVTRLNLGRTSLVE